MSNENLNATLFAQKYYEPFILSFSEEVSRFNVVDNNLDNSDLFVAVLSNFIYLITTPFLSEFLIIFTAICYLIICCFANTKWWVAAIIFRLFFWIRFLFLILIILNCFFYFTFFWNVETGFFFNNILINNFATIFFKFLVLIFVTASISKWFRFVFQNKIFWKSVNEFAFIFLCCIFFLICLISLNDFFLILYLIVAVSLALYGLILINVPLFSNAPETGAKYFLLSVISIGLIFGGIKEIYLFTGHLNLSIIKNAIFEKTINCLTYQELFSIKYAFFFVLIGFFFKLAAAPTHFWAPEIYASLPYELLLFFVVPVKFVFSIIFFKIVKNVFFICFLNDNLNQILYNEIELFLFFCIVFSMLLGSVNALFETNMRKFLAYSSINQIGFLLIGLLSSTSNFFSFTSFLYFTIIYFINLFLFILFFVNFSQLFYVPLEIFKNLSMPQTTELIEPDFFLDYYLTDLKNIYTLKFNFVKDLNKLCNIRAFVSGAPDYQAIKICFFIIVVFSLAGIPPLPGFYSKFYILFYSIQTQYWIIFWTGIFTSILSVFYYLRIIKIMFFEKSYFQINSLIPSFYIEYFDIIFPLFFSNLNKDNTFKIITAINKPNEIHTITKSHVTTKNEEYTWSYTFSVPFDQFCCTWKNTFHTGAGFTNYEFSNNIFGKIVFIPWGMLEEKLAILQKKTPSFLKISENVNAQNFLNFLITFSLLPQLIIEEQKIAFMLPNNVNQKYREWAVWNKIIQFSTYFHLTKFAQTYANNLFVKFLITIELQLNNYVYNFFKEFFDNKTPLEKRGLSFYNYIRLQFSNVQIELQIYLLDWNLASIFIFSMFSFIFAFFFFFETQIFNFTNMLAQAIIFSIF